MTMIHSDTLKAMREALATAKSAVAFAEAELRKAEGGVGVHSLNDAEPKCCVCCEKSEANHKSVACTGNDGCDGMAWVAGNKDCADG